MDDFLGTLQKLFTFAFVITSMLSMGPSLTAAQILQPLRNTRRVLAMGTGQRNLASAFVIATGKFADQPNVLVYLAAAGLVAMVIVMPISAEFGKRREAASEPAGTAATTLRAVTSMGGHA